MAARSLEDRYELRETLGRGGMGVVYRAYDRLLDREVALKTVLDVDDETSRELFRKECSSQSKIVHPNIVEIFDIGEFTDEEGVLRPFYTMPLLPGKTLRQLLDEKSVRLTPERSIGILRSACRGLQAAHDHGLIHRDLKPANIFVMPDDSVKLIDFGIAHAAESGKQTLLKGTLHYLAPELLDMKQPTAMSDIYSLSVVGYEALGGRLPFDGLSSHELAEAIRERTPPPLAELNPNIPEVVSQTVHKGMAKHPWHRFSKAQDLADALGRAMAGQPVELFDNEQVRKRIDRAKLAFDEGDHDFAAEVVRDLEGEGVQSSELTQLRKRVDQTMRQGRIQKLLSSARRFREAGEAPVALKKVSEALDLDPKNSDALALRAEIEKERRGEKRDGWLRVAREHLANGAYDRAREAVDRALELKPDDVDSLELRSEIGSVEREAERARQRKEEIYQTALEAWNRGDVSHALTRMESLMALQQGRPDADGDRAGTYQKLFQEVRSEHESIENGHEQARRALADDRLDEAAAICKKFLAKYPANALFQSLQFDIEERGRLKLSQTIAETDRKVEQEPDLQRKIAILQEAIEAHPGETHFERALALAREKNDLVESIVTKARYLEEQGQIAEAQGQWRMLRSIHPPYPGLEHEIERLDKRAEQHLANAERAERIGEIRALLADDSVEAALRLCQDSWNGDGDAELEELRATAAQRAATQKEIRQLLAQAEEAGAAGRAQERLDRLREARRVDGSNAMVRGALAGALVEQAKELAKKDWNLAAPLVDELTECQPDHPELPTLRKGLESSKEGQFVEQFLERADALVKEGKSEEAIAVMRKSLSLYPNEARLAEKLRDLLGSGNRTAVIKPEDLRRDPVAMSAAAAPPAPEEPAEKPPAPPAGAEAPTALGDAVFEPKQAAQKQASKPAPAPPPAAAAKPAEAQPPKKAPEKAKAAGKSAAAGGDRKAIVAMVGGFIVVLMLALLWMMFGPSGGSEPKLASGSGEQTPVQVTVIPATAEILINGERCGVGSCDVELAAGSHRVTARLAGYETGFQTLQVEPPNVGGADGETPPLEVNLNLAPWQPSLVVQTNRPSGAVYLNGEKIGDIADNEFQLPLLPEGEHEIRIRDAATESNFQVRVASAQAPEVLSLRAVNVDLVLASVMGDSARIHTNRNAVPARLDGQPAPGPMTPEGLSLTGLNDGFHEVSVGEPDGRTTSIGFEASTRPVLAVMVSSDLPTGTLYVSANQDDATVYLNDEPYTRRKIYRGRVRIDPMPGKISVRVEKEGFVSPPAQEVTIQKGRTSRVEFELKPQPKRATLQLTSAPAGADVQIDGKAAGRIGEDGRLTLSGLEAGRHQLSISRAGFQPRQLTVNLEAGQTVQQEASLEPADGKLTVSVSPAGVNPELLLRTSGKPGERKINPGTLELEPGSYSIEARAEGYQPVIANVRVQPAATAEAKIQLVKIVEQKAAPTGPVDYLSLYEESGGWTRQGDRLVRKGGGFVYSPVRPQAGVYRFTAMRQAGDPVRWFIRLGGEQDYWYFQQGTRRLERYKGSAREPETQHDGGVGRNQAFDVEIRVEPGLVVTVVFQDGKQVAADRLEIAGAGFDKGRWGFQVGDKDQIALSKFIFEPK